ncbi:hypothetical protein BDV10DRAFT_98804 [Aspergillus recurvatus]
MSLPRVKLDSRLISGTGSGAIKDKRRGKYLLKGLKSIAMNPRKPDGSHSFSTKDTAESQLFQSRTTGDEPGYDVLASIASSLARERPRTEMRTGRAKESAQSRGARRSSEFPNRMHSLVVVVGASPGSGASGIYRRAGGAGGRTEPESSQGQIQIDCEHGSWQGIYCRVAILVYSG